MDGREFTRRVRRYARLNGLDFSFDPSRGKGSHSQVYLGDLHTTVQHGEIPLGTLLRMLKDLHIDRREF